MEDLSHPRSIIGILGGIATPQWAGRKGAAILRAEGRRRDSSFQNPESAAKTTADRRIDRVVC